MGLFNVTGPIILGPFDLTNKTKPVSPRIHGSHSTKFLATTARKKEKDKID